MSIIELGTSLGEMKEYQALPDGLYDGELQVAELKTNEKNPNGFFSLQFRISPEDFPADYDVDNAPEGVLVTYGYLAIPDGKSRKNVAAFKKVAKAFGETDKSASIDPENWIGKKVQLMLKRGEYLGSEINRIEAISPIPVV
jgi:hypothetical protein